MLQPIFVTVLDSKLRPQQMCQVKNLVTFLQVVLYYQKGFSFEK